MVRNRGRTRTNVVPVPAPVLGVNLFDSLADMDSRDSVYAYNVLPSEYGTRTRRGYREWCTTLGSSSNGVRTLIPFEGDSSSDDALFAATEDGIYDITSSAASPSASHSFASTGGNAGYGVFEAYNNDNGDHYLFYADEANGLIQYDPSGPSWAAKTDITGVTETSLVYVTEHKNRLWFVEKDTSDAWYLGLGVQAGAATKFSLGNKFKRGGHLKGIYKWSVDGGDGADDLLVFISSAGEVAIYQGTDPDYASTWQSVGTWFVGQVPTSRKICENIGGDLHILSVMGALSVQDLISGVNVQQATGQNTIARRVTRAIRNDMPTNKDEFMWDIVPVPSEGSVAILRPYTADAFAIQYVFNFTYPGWGYWRGLPMQCATEWQGTIYFGDGAGNVHYMVNSLDGVARDGSGGDPVEASFLTSFSDLGAPGRNKLVHFIRPRFFSENGAEPSFSAKAVYDYNIPEPNIALPGGVDTSTDVWDTGLWDSAVWGGDSDSATRVIGTCGIGQTVAIAIKMEVSDRTTYLESTLMAEVGGMFD